MNVFHAVSFISYFESIVLLMIYAASMFTWCPHAKPVAKRPNTRNGCAAAWYFTSFLIGSGKKNLNCAKIGGAIKQNKNAGIKIFANASQIKSDEQLRRVDGSNRNPLRFFNPKCDG